MLQKPGQSQHDAWIKTCWQFHPSKKCQEYNHFHQNPNSSAALGSASPLVAQGNHLKHQLSMKRRYVLPWQN
jgi:hypothetical protein